MVIRQDEQEPTLSQSNRRFLGVDRIENPFISYLWLGNQGDLAANKRCSHGWDGWSHNTHTIHTQYLVSLHFLNRTGCNRCQVLEENPKTKWLQVKVRAKCYWGVQDEQMDEERQMPPFITRQTALQRRMASLFMTCISQDNRENQIKTYLRTSF